MAQPRPTHWGHARQLLQAGPAVGVRRPSQLAPCTTHTLPRARPHRRVPADPCGFSPQAPRGRTQAPRAAWEARKAPTGEIETQRTGDRLSETGRERLGDDHSDFTATSETCPQRARPTGSLVLEPPGRPVGRQAAVSTEGQWGAGDRHSATCGLTYARDPWIPACHPCPLAPRQGTVPAPPSLPSGQRGGGGLRSSTGHRSQAVLLPGPSPTPSGLALGRGGPPGEPAKRVQSLRDRGADVTLSMRTEWQLGHRRQPCLPASFWSHKLKWPSMLPAWPAGLRPLTAFGASDCQRPSGVCPRRAQGSVLPQAQGGGGGARRQSPSEGAHVSWSRSHVPLRQGRASGGRPATGHQLGPEALCGSPFPSR